MLKDRQSKETIQTVNRFNRSFDHGDVNGIMSLMTDDCEFDNTEPSPDGTRYVGQKKVRAFWKQFFSSTNSPVFKTEDMFATGNRCCVRWIFYWKDKDGSKGHVRGVDVFLVKNGKIAQKFSYVKG